MAGLVPGSTASPAEELVGREEKVLLRQALAHLPVGHQMVFELAVYQELPYREVARVLEIPLGTVKSRMFHALRMLRDRLAVPPRVRQEKKR